jgi:hypothetical protein
MGFLLIFKGVRVEKRGDALFLRVALGECLARRRGGWSFVLTRMPSARGHVVAAAEKISAAIDTNARANVPLREKVLS